MESGEKWKMQKVVKRPETRDNFRRQPASVQRHAMTRAGCFCSIPSSQLSTFSLAFNRLVWNKGQSLPTRYVMLASSESSESRLMGVPSAHGAPDAAQAFTGLATALAEDFC